MLRVGRQETRRKGKGGEARLGDGLLSANSGNLTVLAGADKQYSGTGQGNLLSQGANLQAKQTATLQGNAVTLDAITNQDNSQYHQESKSFTIGSQLSGSVGSVITGIYDAAQAARHTSNDRLQGALALKAGYDAYKLANGGIGTALKAEDTMNTLNKASTEAGKGTVNNNSAAFAVSATVGSNRSSQDSSSSSTTQRGTIVQADTLNIIATDGNLSATGAKLQATDINLSASKDILLQAATNTAEVHNKNDSSNASAGATFGFGQQNGISFQLGVGQSQGVANGSETTYDNTLVTASNQLNLHSGNDTTLFGAQLAGKTVNADVGGKLAITTLQDQSQYESHQSSSGFDISVCVPP
uniref:hemagglutinin repeat-containing protein n=1 Tax=Aquitalea sp. TaxID=1872623 RepID=UPI0025845E3B